MAPLNRNAAQLPGRQNLLLVILCAVITGCEGKSLVDDNPVFVAAPPRRSLTNKAGLATADDNQTQSVIKSVGYERDAGQELTGNTIVAEVNGKPIFVDDLIGSIRLAVEANPEITAEQRQKILYMQTSARISNYVEQEIVLQALNQAIPEDRRKLIEDSLEEPFQEVITKIKADRKLESDKQLNDVLAEEGLSIDLLRESFVRIQKVQGYLSTIAPAPGAIERPELVAYYKDHQDEFTTSERIRCQELVVRFDRHEGHDGAEAVMAEAVKQLQEGADFAEIATRYSDALSAEKRGDMGWLERGNLADKDLEQRLFELQSGEMTKVYVRTDRFEVYRVVDHQQKRVAELKEVQNEIEQKLRQQHNQEARTATLKKLRSTASVVTIFDDDAAVTDRP